MFCPQCGGIQEVIKVHSSENYEPRLCDVRCLNCDHIVYYQAYDFGKKFNVVVNKKNTDK